MVRSSTTSMARASSVLCRAAVLRLERATHPCPGATSAARYCIDHRVVRAPAGLTTRGPAPRSRPRSSLSGRWRQIARHRGRRVCHQRRHPSKRPLAETAQVEPSAPAAVTDTAPTAAEVPSDEGNGATWWPWVIVALHRLGGDLGSVGGEWRSGPSRQTRTTSPFDAQIEQLTSHLVALTPMGCTLWRSRMR